MKIALVFVGHVRNFERAAPFWKTNVFDSSVHDVDVFIHTWSKRGTHIARPESKFSSQDDFNEDYSVDNLRDLYKPVSLIIEDQSALEHWTIYDTNKFEKWQLECGNPTLTSYNPARYFWMHQKIRRAWNVVESCNKYYDVVIKTRLDRCPASPITIFHEPNIIYALPKTHDDDISGWVEDQFLLGTYADMKVVMNARTWFETAFKNVEANRYFNPHTFLYDYITAENLSIKEININWKYF